MPFIFMLCALPSSSRLNRAKASQFISWYSHLMAKVLAYKIASGRLVLVNDTI